MDASSKLTVKICFSQPVKNHRKRLKIRQKHTKFINFDAWEERKIRFGYGAPGKRVVVCAMARFSLLSKEERQMEKTKKNFYKSKYFHLVVCVALAIVTALILLPFGRSQKQSGHDIRYHLNVIRSLSVAWDSGNFFSKIA